MNWLSQNFSKQKSFIAIPIFLLAILAMIILPLPAWLLDVLFTFNIVLAVLVLLASVSIKRPLDFSIFPTLLLFATLMRLTLNVASTRVVLLHGNEGAAAAGKVIEAFGKVVIGGNYVIGAVVFMILMIINFMVVTKGGERISEVSARFTLDALPGKQMAIDADLNAGIINQEQAKKRRAEVAGEAEFYGSMDGASKFVRGDAVAGMLVLAINIIGGIAIGIFMHGMDAAHAFKTYALLTIGDGLVAQIPSLLLATAAAIIVTRVSDSKDVPEQFQQQLLSNPKTIITAAFIMVVMGLVPGMPSFAFISFAALLGFIAWKLKDIEPNSLLEALEEKVETSDLEPPELTWNTLPFTDLMSVNLGYRLVPLAEKTKGAELIKRLTGIRKTISEQSGFLLGEIRVRDNLSLAPNAYTIAFMGNTMVKKELEPEKLLAIKSGEIFGEIDGILTRDPAYNMEAVWIEPSLKSKALNYGYSVVDNASIIATHVAKIIKENLANFLQHDDIVALQERLATISPKLAESLSSALQPIQQLKVLRLLLKENVYIKDIRTISTTLLECSETTKDPILLTADVRCALKETIINKIVGDDKSLNVMTLSSSLENMLSNALTQAQNQGKISLDSFPVEPQLLSQLQQKMPQLLAEAKMQKHHPILLVPPQLRPLLARYALVFAKGLNVISYNEMPEDKEINVVGQLG